VTPFPTQRHLEAPLPVTEDSLAARSFLLNRDGVASPAELASTVGNGVKKAWDRRRETEASKKNFFPSQFSQRAALFYFFKFLSIVSKVTISNSLFFLFFYYIDALSHCFFL